LALPAGLIFVGHDFLQRLSETKETIHLLESTRGIKRAGFPARHFLFTPFREEEARGIFSFILFRVFALREKVCRDEAASQLSLVQ